MLQLLIALGLDMSGRISRVGFIKPRLITVLQLPISRISLGETSAPHLDPMKLVDGAMIVVRTM